MRSSAAFRALRPVQRHELSHEMIRVATYIAAGERRDRTPAMAVILDGRSARIDAAACASDVAPDLGPHATGKRMDSTNFQIFATDLIGGIFGEIITASDEQMLAYAALIKQLCRSLDDASSRHTAAHDSELAPATRERIALERQQLLATTVLAGIRRIIGTGDTFSARVVFNAA